MAASREQCSVQWVPSHIGVQGNGCVDHNAAEGANIAQQKVLAQKEVPDIWEQLGRRNARLV